MAAFDYDGLRQRALLHREQYDQGALERAREADLAGYSNPNMFSNESRTRWNTSMAGAQANYAPEWDTWFQAGQEANPKGLTPSYGGGRQRKRQAGSVSALQGPSLAQTGDPNQTGLGSLSLDALLDASRKGRPISKG